MRWKRISRVRQDAYLPNAAHFRKKVASRLTPFWRRRPEWIHLNALSFLRGLGCELTSDYENGNFWSMAVLSGMIPISPGTSGT